LLIYKICQSSAMLQNVINDVPEIDYVYILCSLIIIVVNNNVKAVLKTAYKINGILKNKVALKIV